MLAGLILGARNGSLAVLLFLFVVALGAPVLSGGRGGLGVFFGPTIGFLVGWVAGAWACGFLNMQFRKWAPAWPHLCALSAALLGGIVVIYAFGVPGIVLKTELTFVKAFLAAAVFVPGDILKCLVAAWIASRIRPRLI